MTGKTLEKTAWWLVLMVWLGYFPFFPRLHSANELSRLYLAWSIVYDGDLKITNQIREFGDIGDKSIRNHEFYSDKPPGTAFLAVPVLYLKKLLGLGPDLELDLRLARLTTTLFAGIVLLILLKREMEVWGIPPEDRAVVVLVTGLGSLAFTYSILYYGHITTAFFIFWGYYLTRNIEKPYQVFLVGFSLAMAVLSEYQAAVYGIPIALYVCWALRKRPQRVLLALLGALLPLALLMFYHYKAFGSPFKTSYNFVANPYFASIHHKGFMGLVFPRLRPLLWSLFSPSKGLYFYTPAFLLGTAGLFLLHRDPRGRLAIIVGLLPFLFVACMVYYQGGWTVGQRHLTPAVPFLALGLGLALRRWSLARLFAPGLIAASIVITGLSTLVFPHIPAHFANPLGELILPLADRGCMVKFLWMEGRLWSAVALLAALAVLMLYLLLRCSKGKLYAISGLVLIPSIMIVASSRYLPPNYKVNRAIQPFVEQYRAAGCRSLR